VDLWTNFGGFKKDNERISNNLTVDVSNAKQNVKGPKIFQYFELAFRVKCAFV